MEFTLLFSKVVGPVLLVRALTLMIDRQHFHKMVEGLEAELTTVAFSFFPVALMMASLAIVATHRDTSSPAAYIIHIAAWGGLAKSAGLMAVPKLVVKKAQLLVNGGFLYVVLLSCSVVGGYLSWFGFFSSPS
jgi:hypothetical protein